MTRLDTNSLSQGAKLKRAIELRNAGVPLTKIGKEIGYSKAWTCKILKKAGIAPTTVIDKNGVRRTPHGMKWTSEYYSWISMRTRCMCPNHPTYKDYGGRGITLDPRWLDFHEFYADMGSKPSKEYTIDRIDVNKGYYKENCRWLPRKHQNRNTRANVLTAEQVLEIRAKVASGTKQCEIMKQYGLTNSHVSSIINRKCWKDI